jgi:hypothetical protein
LLGCGGDQSGDEDCGGTPIDFDATTALGFPPALLWDTYVGRYESVGEWWTATGSEPGDRVRVTIEVSRDQFGDGVPYTCRDVILDNEVRVPVVVRIDSGDGSVSGTERVWLQGNLRVAFMTLPDDMGVRGWINLGEDGSASFQLSPANDLTRDIGSVNSLLEP